MPLRYTAIYNKDSTSILTLLKNLNNNDTKGITSPLSFATSKVSRKLRQGKVVRNCNPITEEFSAFS